MNLRRVALVVLCFAFAAAAGADGPADAGQVERWIDQALHGRGEERDRAIRFLAALGGDAVDRLLAAARREGAATQPAPIAPPRVVPPEVVLPSVVPPQVVPPEPVPSAARRYAVEARIFTGTEEAIAAATRRANQMIAEGKDPAGALQDLPVGPHGGVATGEAVEGVLATFLGGKSEPVEYRREVRRDAAGSWSVAKEKIREGPGVTLSVRPKDGRLAVQWFLEFTTVARPVPTAQIRPAPDAPAFEIDAPQWTRNSISQFADLPATGGVQVFAPGMRAPDDSRVVVLLRVTPKP